MNEIIVAKYLLREIIKNKQSYTVSRLWQEFSFSFMINLKF